MEAFDEKLFFQLEDACYREVLCLGLAAVPPLKQSEKKRLHEIVGRFLDEVVPMTNPLSAESARLTRRIEAYKIIRFLIPSLMPRELREEMNEEILKVADEKI